MHLLNKFLYYFMETGLFSPSTRINFGKLFSLEIIYFIWGSKFVYIKLYKIVSFFFLVSSVPMVISPMHLLIVYFLCFLPFFLNWFRY